jgi:virginiamycin B lyase
LQTLEDRTVPTTIGFTLNQSASSLSLSGTIVALGLTAPLVEQGAGSMTSHYSGTMLTDVDFSGNTINFVGSAASDLIANISGTWMPMIGGGIMGNPGSDPAPYASMFTLLGNVNWSALRDIVNTLSTSAALPLSGGGGSFSFPSTQTLNIVSGNLDYNTAQFGVGRTGFNNISGPNMAANNGTLHDNGDGTFTISCPIDQTSVITLAGGAVTLTLHTTGLLTGTGSPVSSNPIHEFPTTTAAAGPSAIAQGPDGNVWFVESAVGQIGYITPSGSVTEFSVPNVAGDIGGIAAGPDGNLWFTEPDANQIGQITTAGAVTEFALPTAGALPTGIAAGPDGNMWFTEKAANQIGNITTDGNGTITEFAVTTAGAAPTGIAAGPDGNMWFTEQAANQIGNITTDGNGTVTEFAVTTAGASPTGIARGPDGNMWFTEQAANQIGNITTDGNGTVTEFAVTTAGAAPTGIVAGPDGNMWFTEPGANQIAKITTDGSGTVTEIGGLTANSGPYGIAVGADNNLWFTEQSASQIGQYVFGPGPATGGSVRAASISASSATLDQVVVPSSSASTSSATAAESDSTVASASTTAVGDSFASVAVGARNADQLFSLVSVDALWGSEANLFGLA